MGRAEQPLLIVADKAGIYPAVDRGIRMAADLGVLSHVDLAMRDLYSARSALTLIRQHPGLSIGLQICLPSANRLHPNRESRHELLRVTDKQLRSFQDITGKNPTHLSIHGDLHMNAQYEPHEWFLDRLKKILGDDFYQVIIKGLDTQIINPVKWRSLVQKGGLLLPWKFKELLESTAVQQGKKLELVVAPALHQRGDPLKIAGESTLMKEKQLQALLMILLSGVIKQAGYRIVRK